jgi:carbonic anhydrase
MACKIGSSPININSNSGNIQTCDITCKYTYTYGNSSLSATNNGDHISLSYDGSVDVQYNSRNYNIQEIRLYRSSLNNYNGNKMDGELIIHHIDNTNKNLLICVPIKNNNSMSKSKILFSKIIPFIPSSTGTTTTINVTDYNLNTFIPQAPYYAYKGSLPYQPCTGTYDIIIFHPDYAINMSDNDLNTITQVITSINNNSNIKTNENPLYFNKTGTTKNTGGTGDDIYIQCNALDNDGNIIPNENEIIRENERTERTNSKSILNNDTEIYLESLGGVIGGMILVFGISYGFNYMINKK